MPSSKVLEIELRVDAALRLRVTQLERALAQADAALDTERARGLVDLAQRDRNRTWQTCAQLAAALRNGQRWALDLSYVPEWDAVAEKALALVQPQCNHPIAAITRNPDGTQVCRACAAEPERGQ